MQLRDYHTSAQKLTVSVAPFTATDEQRWAVAASITCVFSAPDSALRRNQQLSQSSAVPMSIQELCILCVTRAISARGFAFFGACDRTKGCLGMAPLSSLQRRVLPEYMCQVAVDQLLLASGPLCL